MKPTIELKTKFIKAVGILSRRESLLELLKEAKTEKDKKHFTIRLAGVTEEFNRISKEIIGFVVPDEVNEIVVCVGSKKLSLVGS
jgi:hypothetical protein